MKKRISKFLSMLLVLSCITGTLSTATAIEPRYTGLYSLTVSLDIAAGGASTSYGYALLRSGYTADMTLTLQRSSNGYSWSSVKEWTSSGSGTISLDKTYYITSGYDYRAKCSLVVYDSSNSIVDNVTKYSATVSY
ncbi:hypothetical protein CE91St43_26640 [Oscillospiraceae bacterium]|nr:hypothetical protein CE91St43_26640 [Oscillospiraceae bacterium]